MTPVEEFVSAARKILWRIHPHLHTEYHEWNSLVQRLQSTRKYTRYQAMVQASKDFECLHDLFGCYDLSLHDPDPSSHGDLAAIAKARKEAARGNAPGVAIKSEGVSQSHRQNLTWALEAAGRFLRTAEEPAKCPNDAAYYLYRRAIEEPKEFLAKVTQTESKVKTDDGDERAGKRSIRELGEMLETLAEEGEVSEGNADTV